MTKLFLSIITIIIVYNAVYSSEDEDYYYYEDEDDSSSFNSNVAKYGFVINDNNADIYDLKPLVNELYLNETAEVYDCVKKIHASTLILEEIEYEEKIDLSKQSNDLKRKIELAHNPHAAGDSSSTMHSSTANLTVHNETITQKPERRLSFREKQELRMKERKEQVIKKEILRPKLRLGADCETLICGSCKVIVEEFSKLVYSAVNDTNYNSVEDVTKDFCKSKNIGLKYVDMVGDICTNFENVIKRKNILKYVFMLNV
jgi:hypothetical protein